MTSSSSMWPMDDSSLSLLTSSTCLMILALVLGGCYLFKSLFMNSTPWEKYGITRVRLGWGPALFNRYVHQKMLEEHGETIGFDVNGPNVLSSDPELYRAVMSKDFDNFANRKTRLKTNTQFTRGLFFAKDDIWKRKRQFLSPYFSTAKLKTVLLYANEKSKRMSNYMAQCAEQKKLIHVRDLCVSFTSEIIAQSALGCKIDCIGGEETHEFSMYCQKIFKSLHRLRRICMALFLRRPWLRFLTLKVFRFSYCDLISQTTMDYFISILKESIDQRLAAMKEGKTVPLDFLQMLLAGSELIDTGRSGSREEYRFTMDDLIGSVVVMIFAGFETTATTLQFLLYELAVHQDVQDKVLQEIEDTVQGDDPTHEELNKLKYTKQVIDETLRIFPPVDRVNREPLKDYKYGDITIPAKSTVLLSLFAMHRNPKYWPNPEVFDPDRFNPEEQAKRHPYSFTPFGMGPRQCIGMRLAYLELKLTLVNTLRRVKVTVNERTTPRAGENVKLKKVGIVSPVEPIKIAVEHRRH